MSDSSHNLHTFTAGIYARRTGGNTSLWSYDSWTYLVCSNCAVADPIRRRLREPATRCVLVVKLEMASWEAM